MPGFVALRLFRAKYPVKEQSEFAEAAWSVIYGVLLVTVLRWCDRRWLHGFLNTNSTDLPGLRFALALVAVGLLWGGLLIFVHYLRFKCSGLHGILRGIAPDPQSIWAKINQPSNKDWAVVYCDDGAIYRGWIKEYTFDPDKDHNDFLLADAARVNDQLQPQYSVNGSGVYLSTRNVIRIEFVR